MVSVCLANTMKAFGIDMIEDIAFDVDEFISTMITKYKTDPLILGSIVLARLMLANEYMGSGDDFRKLAAHIPKKTINKEAIH